MYTVDTIYVQYIYIHTFIYVFSAEGKSRSGVVEFGAVGILLIGGNKIACWCSQVDHKEY